MIWRIFNLACWIDSKIAQCPRRRQMWPCYGRDCDPSCRRRLKLEDQDLAAGHVGYVNLISEEGKRNG